MKSSTKPTISPYRFCTAPLMDWSDRHCRYFWRLMSKHSRLYTEMVTTGALLYGDANKHLKFDAKEHPVAIQLGGSDTNDLAKAAKLCEQAGYDEVNLNVGCPSDRVQSGAFGACLMNEPQTVADGIKAMRNSVSIPVTIKCRLGVDHNDSYEALVNFIGLNQEAGCNTFIVHARKAWLSGLSPKENREIPPLHYDRVFKLKKDFPELTIVLNGGLKSLSECKKMFNHVDGVMLGREAYQNPRLLLDVDTELFENPNELESAYEVALSYRHYIEQELGEGQKLSHMTRHILGLFNGYAGAKRWRRHLSENAHKKESGIAVYDEALAMLEIKKTQLQFFTTSSDEGGRADQASI